MPLGLVRNEAKVVREEEQDYDIPLQDDEMQPLTPQTVHITPPDDDYVAPATNPIFNKHLKEFKEEFSDYTKVSNEIDSNPVNDLKELLNTYDFETFIQKLLHQVSESSYETGKTKREMKSHHLLSLQGDGIRAIQVEAMLGGCLATGKHVKSGLVGYHSMMMMGCFAMMDVAQGSRLGAWLKACCLFIKLSKSRGVFHSNSTLIFNFHFLNVKFKYLARKTRIGHEMQAYTDSPRVLRRNHIDSLDGKLLLVDDNWKLLNKVEYAQANSDSDSDVEVAYDETT
ncbi:hypothetical protein Tco_0183770 [Tanacetum coccineum]